MNRIILKVELWWLETLSDYILLWREVLTLISCCLELALDVINSFCFGLLSTLTSNPMTTSRAWWDNKKGSAIVLYAPYLDNQQGESDPHSTRGMPSSFF